jgi:hypothetical protein
VSTPTADTSTWDHQGMPDGTDQKRENAAEQLYALVPEEFVAARNTLAAQAKAAGDKELAKQIAALPKPTVAAWLLNTFARRRPDAVDQLVDLGAELRAAQDDLAPAELKALNRQRHAVVVAFARQVAALAADLGRPVTASVSQQVDETLRAALVDGDLGAALGAGRLTASSSYAGMGTGAGALSGAPPRRMPADRPATRSSAADLAAQQRRVQEAQAAADAAAGRVSATEAELRRHEQHIGDCAARETELTTRIEALRVQLAQADSQLADVQRRRQVAEGQRAEAASADADAREALHRARAALDSLRNDVAANARPARRNKESAR